MKSRKLLNLILLLVIGALGAVLFLEPGREKPVSTPVATLDRKALERITLENANGSMVLERKDGQWRLAAPFAAPVNPARVEQLLAIPDAKSQAHYPLAAGDLARFGLDRPAVVLVLDGTRLEFGGTDPINLRRYVKVGEVLHLVDDDFYHHLSATATDYVDKQLVPEGSAIIGIETPGHKASRGDDGNWVQEPPAGDADLAEWETLWSTARAIGVSRPAADGSAVPAGGTESIRIRLQGGGVVEYGIVQKAPALVLMRRDLGLSFELTPETSAQLLQPPVRQTGETGPVPAAQQKSGERREPPGVGEEVHDGEDGHEDE